MLELLNLSKKVETGPCQPAFNQPYPWLYMYIDVSLICMIDD